VTTQLIKPLPAQPFDVRCNVGDAVVANLAIHIVFFFDRQLDTGALQRSFANALTQLPVFAGRLTVANGRMAIRCEGQGVPFSCVWSDLTLDDAILSTSADAGGWLVDPVNGVTARWGLGPLCKVRVTQLADDSTAIGFSWHHAVGDMQTLMIFMNAWVAAAVGKPVAAPVMVEDRAAYLDAHLPTDTAAKPGVRCLTVAEVARFALYLLRDARKQRTLSVYFGDGEIARMRHAYGNQMRLSTNDVVCAHVCEELMNIDSEVGRRTLAIVVNARSRCGIDPLLIGNIVTTLNLDLPSREPAASIAGRIRDGVDHFADEHCDMRANQQFLDNAGVWRTARCVTGAFDPARWNPLVTNWSGFGLYDICFEDTIPSYYTPVLQTPISGVGVVTEGAGGRGVLFHMTLPIREFEAMSSAASQERLHRFRSIGDEIPYLHSAVHG
jgi:transferase family protein